MFKTTNFPSASTTNLADARALYAVLTGRVSPINADARLNENTGKYVYLATGSSAASCTSSVASSRTSGARATT